MEIIMPRHNRILVRYRLPESNDQWSELQWCDIEKNAEDGSIQVRVAPARGAVMPEDRAFTVLPPEDAKKLLVWDVSSDENARAYCLVIQANALYRFDFDSRTDLLIAGKYWSLEKNDFDKDIFIDISNQAQGDYLLFVKSEYGSTQTCRIIKL